MNSLAEQCPVNMSRRRHLLLAAGGTGAHKGMNTFIKGRCLWVPLWTSKGRVPRDISRSQPHTGTCFAGVPVSNVTRSRLRGNNKKNTKSSPFDMYMQTLCVNSILSPLFIVHHIKIRAGSALESSPRETILVRHQHKPK